MSARHRAEPVEVERLTPPPTPEASIRATDNSGEADLPQLSQDPDWRPEGVSA